MSRRRAPLGPLEWALRIVIALLIAAVGVLIGGAVAGKWGPWKTTSASVTTTTTSRSGASTSTTSSAATTPTTVLGTANEEIAIKACQNVGPLQQEIAGTISDLQTYRLYQPIPSGPDSPLTDVLGMINDASSPTFAKAASDASTLEADWGSANSTGTAESFGPMSSAAAALAADCQGFGYATTSP